MWPDDSFISLDFSTVMDRSLDLGAKTILSLLQLFPSQQREEKLIPWVISKNLLVSLHRGASLQVLVLYTYYKSEKQPQIRGEARSA